MGCQRADVDDPQDTCSNTLHTIPQRLTRRRFYLLRHLVSGYPFTLFLGKTRAFIFAHYRRTAGNRRVCLFCWKQIIGGTCPFHQAGFMGMSLDICRGKPAPKIHITGAAQVHHMWHAGLDYGRAVVLRPARHPKIIIFIPLHRHWTRPSDSLHCFV